MMETIKANVKKLEGAAEKNGIVISLIEYHEEVTLGHPYDETFPATASVFAGREILVSSWKGKPEYTLISKQGDTIKRYTSPAAVLKAARKYSEIDGEV